MRERRNRVIRVLGAAHLIKIGNLHMIDVLLKIDWIMACRMMPS